jgi:uncharacterized protein (DUF362 family)
MSKSAEGTVSHFKDCVLRGGVLRGPIPPSTEGIQARAGLVAVAADSREVFAAIKLAIAQIDGWAFLSRPGTPRVVLIKPAINWGVTGYPSVSSPESIYAVTRLTLEEAAARDVPVRIIVGEQSGVEIKLWGGSTLANMEHTGILDGALRAAVDWAAAREAGGDLRHAGAGLVLASVEGRRASLRDTEAVRIAARAGLVVEGFDHAPHVRVPVPGGRHFPEGILLPEVLAREVTDLVNVPRPPGRHVLMGGAGLTGAVKSHVGLLGASDRVPALHGPFDRYPALGALGVDSDGFAAHLRHLADRVARRETSALLAELRASARVDPEALGPGAVFQEKLVELFLAVRDKERFSVTDMRRTMSSMGPDLGDTIDVGLVIAASDPVTLDLIAASALKHRYEQIGMRSMATLVDTPGEFLAGKGFLPDGASAFDLLQIRAAMAYGVAPLGPASIDLAASGFGPGEREAVTARLESGRRG